MIFAGVDIAKTDHVIDCVDERGTRISKPMPFKNEAAGFEKCIAWLEGVAEKPEDAIIAMEATGHYWMACFSYLVARGWTVCVINPMHVHAVRNLKSLSGVKNDRIDAYLIAETLRIGEYDATKLATDEVQSLRELTRYRQSLRDQIAETKTKVICLMDSYFPEYASLFTDMFGAASMALLREACLPAGIARKTTPGIEKIISSASRGRFKTEKAAQIRACAKASVGVKLGSDAASLAIREYVDLIGFLEKKADHADDEIERILSSVEPLILTIPGISVTLGAQIVAEVGDIARFRNASALVKYAGLNSGVNQSGQFEAQGAPITKKGSPYLRRAIWLAADRARMYDPKLREFYEKKISEGKAHRVAVTAVARKLCHIIFAVMRDQVPFDSAR
ncbi:MAG: IS110 family transposase [Eggerthellaceae bacterium]|nr:IS110 family transposase [Eggerthellaceae bacterium]